MLQYLPQSVWVLLVLHTCETLVHRAGADSCSATWPLLCRPVSCKVLQTQWLRSLWCFATRMFRQLAAPTASAMISCR